MSDKNIYVQNCPVCGNQVGVHIKKYLDENEQIRRRLEFAWGDGDVPPGEVTHIVRTAAEIREEVSEKARKLAEEEARSVEAFIMGFMSQTPLPLEHFQLVVVRDFSDPTKAKMIYKMERKTRNEDES